jgi:hypothetical protein
LGVTVKMISPQVRDGRSGKLPRHRNQQAQPWSASRSYRGEIVTVQMINPQVRDGAVIVWGAKRLMHTRLTPAEVKRPTPITGQYLPARFTAKVAGCTVKFTLTRVETASGDYTDHVRISDLHVTCNPDGQVLDLPLPLLRSLAIQASTFAAFIIPPHFTWTDGQVTYTTDKAGDYHVVSRGQPPPEVLDVLTDGTDLLRDVARIYATAPYGRKWETIAAHYGYSHEWAHKQVRLARKKHPGLFAKSTRKKGRT